jgi:RNA polymerase sigma factor (TIGR02999 family)
MPDNDSIGPKEIQATRFASEEMIVELYTELRTMANAKLNKQPPGQTLQATALVHDVYLRLSKDSNQRWDNKGHFFATAAEAMRRILVEQARRKSASKRGGNVEKRPFHEHEIQAPEADEKTLQVNEALDLLEAEDSVKAAIE